MKRYSIPAILLSVCLAACSAGGGPPPEPPPPEICKTPVAPTTPWFHDATAELGLAPGAALTPLANSVQSADLDGDGYPDLLAHIGTNIQREAGGKRYNFLLMNRPAAGGKRRFVDSTAESGILATADGQGGRVVGVANFGDLDNDGDLDVVMCPGSAGDSKIWVMDFCTAFLNDGMAKFSMRPSPALDAAGAWTCASSALLDYDRDGILDFWPATIDVQAGMQPLLFHGLGDGTFSDDTARMGLPLEQGDPNRAEDFPAIFGVTPCDLDGDGDQDVLLADYGRQLNRAYRNDGDRFVEIGESLGVWADDRMDYSDDHSYRCYCQSNPGKCPPTVLPPEFSCSFTRGWFPGSSDQPYRLGGNTFSIACGDLDNDGDLDLMTAEIRHSDVGSASDPSELLYNDAGPGSPLGKFRRPGNAATGLERKHPESAWNEGDMTPVFADIDLDGRKDIYLTTSDYPDSVNHGWLWRQKEDGTFQDVTAASGAGHKQIHGIALVDIDRDGDLDLVAGTSTARTVAPAETLKVYLNDIGQNSNWIQVRLAGKGRGGANKAAIGARVKVTAGGVTQLQEVSGGYGHTATQSDTVLTFGLGAACSVDRIEVRWPDAAGTVSSFGDVRANYRVEIVEGEERLKYLKVVP